MTQSGRPLETIRDTAPDRTPPPPPQRRSPRHGPVWPGLLLYGLLALVAYLPVWPGNPRRVPWCPCGDTAQSIWFLRWTPFALTHGHSLYASDWIDFPSGFNLAQNVSMLR
jgi:hypothetical protein